MNTTAMSTPPVNTAGVSPQQVNSLLSNEQHNLTALLALLKQEQQALADRDSQGLQQLLAQKQQLMQALEQNGKTRLQLLQHLKLSPNGDGWRQLLRQLDQQHRSNLRQLWQQVEAQLKQCRELNDTNAKIIKRTQFSVGHVLDLLRGKVGQPKLYNQKGVAGYGSNSASNGTSRSITTA